MNLQHQFIDNACRIAVLDTQNNFTEGQKKEMLILLDDFKRIKITNLYKFQKKLKKFEDVFISYGGNHDKLEENIRKIRDETYLQAAKAIPGIKIMKDGKQI